MFIVKGRPLVAVAFYKAATGQSRVMVYEEL